MVHVASLPVETIIKIMELSVEDALAIDDHITRRKILLNLSLISIKYAFLAQEILWRRLELAENARNDVVLLGLLKRGFGRNIAVKNLTVGLSYIRGRIEGMNFKAEMEKVNVAVDSVASIERLVVGILTFGALPPLLNLPKIFRAPSLSMLQSLDLRDVILDPLDNILPPTLKHVQFMGRNREDFEPFFLALQNSNVVLDHLVLGLSEFCEDPELPWSTMKDWFKLGGASIRTIDFGLLDLEQCALFLPFLPSLKSLHFHSSNPDESNNFLQNLLTTIRLQSLESNGHDFDDSEDYIFNNADVPLHYVLSLAVLPQLFDLEVFRLISVDYKEGPAYEEGNLEDISKVIRMRSWVDTCWKVGVRLVFWTLEDERVVKEKDNQKYYKRRRLAYRKLYRDRF